MPKKVFELAKEIGVGAIDLVEQLKGMGLNVRNHMVSLSDEEIEKMKAEAEANADEDKKKKELVDTRNMADQVIFMTEKAIKDAGDRAPEDVVKGINEKVDALKAVKDGEDLEAIKKATDDLSAEVQKIAEHMQEEQAAGEEGEAKADVEDAEVVNEE